MIYIWYILAVSIIPYYDKILKRRKAKKVMITFCASINFIDYIPLAISWNHVNEDTT